MSKHAEDRLSITLPVRMSPTIYKLLEREAYREVVCNAGLVRIAVTEYLKKKGVQIPKPMDCWQELEKKAELRKAVQAEFDKSCFIPLPS